MESFITDKVDFDIDGVQGSGKVYWRAKFEYRTSGIKGLSIFIDKIEGLININMEDEKDIDMTFEKYALTVNIYFNNYMLPLEDTQFSLYPNEVIVNTQDKKVEARF